MNMGSDPVEEIDLRPYVAMLWRHNMLTALFAIAGAGVVIAMTLIAGATYRAYAIVLLPLTGMPSAASALMGGGSATPLSYLQGILESDAALDRVASRNESECLTDILEPHFSP